MKIKLDENLPEALAESLENLGHEVHTVLGEGLKGRNEFSLRRVLYQCAQNPDLLPVPAHLTISPMRK